MANELKATGTIDEGTMSAFLILSSNGYMWDTNAGAFAATPTAANAAIELTEAGSTGRMVGDIPAAALTAAAGLDIKVEYMDAVPAAVAFDTTVAEREVIHIDTAGAVVIEGTKSRLTRVNLPAGRSFRRSVSSRADGTHEVTAPVRIRVGLQDSIAVGIDMMPLFGEDYVSSVGTPTVDPSGEITAAVSGPRDTEAMVVLGGTSTASSTYTVTVPVTMGAGESVDVDFDVETFAD